MWIFSSPKSFLRRHVSLLTINRSAFSTAFGIGSNTLDINLGAGNTVVLIIRPSYHGLAGWSAQFGRRNWSVFSRRPLVLVAPQPSFLRQARRSKQKSTTIFPRPRL